MLGPTQRSAFALQLTSPQQKQEMKLHYEKATRAYDVGKYQEAIDEYQKAYEIGGDPPMLYNIAQAYRLNDQPADAVRFYRRYLQRQPTARNREDVERKIAELEKILEERRKAAAAAPPPVPVPPPPLPVPAVAPPPASAPSAVVAAPSVAPSPEPPRRASTARKVVGWSLIGAGVVAGALGGYEAKVAKDKSDKLGAASRSSPPVAFDPAVEQNGKNANLAAIILWGAGGAAVVAGAIVLFTGGSTATEGNTQTARATVAPWVGGGLVGAGAAFHF